MKTALKIEELAMFLFGIYLFAFLPYAWWWFVVFLLTPDLGMLGYLVNDRIGAFLYNIFHHKGMALAIYVIGAYLSVPIVQFVGIILFSHSAMDRIFGYGLKYEQGFKFTHLGEIGK